MPAVTAAEVLKVSPDKAGVVKDGLVPNTSEPLPVSSVTAAARLAELGVPKNVRMPDAVEVVEGAAPAPPPITNAFAVSALELAMVVVPLKYGIPPEVPEVIPVPPCATVTAAPVVSTVPELSGNVKVRLAPSVVGVIVTANEDVPPARPASTTASCVDAASALTEFAARKV